LFLMQLSLKSFPITPPPAAASLTSIARPQSLDRQKKSVSVMASYLKPCLFNIN